MKFEISILILVVGLRSLSAEFDEEEISFERELETNESCNRQILISYNMNGRAKAVLESHPYCPSIRENCCTLEDAEWSKNLWERKTKF